MKICRISYSLPPILGGLEQHVEELSIHQARRGIEVHLVYAFGAVPSINKLHAHKVEFYQPAAAEKSTSIKFRFMRQAWSTLWRLTRQEQFDVIDVHGDFVEAFFVGLLGKLTRTPTVLTIQAELNERPRARWCSRMSFALVTHIVAQTEAIARQVRARGVSAQRISVISNGVDLQRFRESLPSPSENLHSLLAKIPRQKIVLFVGRLTPLKGVPVLLEAIPLVNAKCPRTQFIIAGDGPDEAALKLQARNWDNVHFVGRVQPHEVVWLLSRAYAFVCPSVPLPGQSEGPVRTVMEAMAAGLPVVASRTGGIPEYVRDGIEGRLVPPSDPVALAEALCSLLTSPEDARRMGTHNRTAIAVRDYSEIERAVTELFERLRRKRQSL